ncbi:MAG: hypothetical protein ACREB5_11970 [Sphingomonadaceae bacterium]
MKFRSISLALAMAFALPALAHAAEKDCCAKEGGKPNACCEKKADGSLPACCDKHKDHGKPDKSTAPEKAPADGHAGHDGHH